MSLRVATLLVVAALFASGCGSGDASPPPLVTSTTTVPTDTDTDTDTNTDTNTEATTETAVPTSSAPSVSVEQVDCPDHLERADGEQLACGVVTVPVDRGGGVPGTTRVTIATLAGGDAGFTTPLAVLQGGPGGASSEMGAWFPRQAFTQVFVDQRGTGFVGPDFDCPEIVDVLGQVLEAGSVEASVVAQEAYDECARRLGDGGVLEFTDSESHAADVVDVMTALGYERWTAYGVSYGSTIALEILRDAPPGLGGVVLDGVYPPELDTDEGVVSSAERALDEIDVACAADAVCRGHLADGSFRTTLERVMEELDRSPMIVPVAASDIGLDRDAGGDGVADGDGDVDVVLDGRRVAELSFLLMYHESLLRHLPAVIGGLDGRDESSARWLARTGAGLLVSAQGANDEGTYFSVQCRDRLPYTAGPGDDPPAFGGAVGAVGLADACDGWRRSPAEPDVAEPVTGAIPALLLSGSFDPITPPEYAIQVGERLEAATIVEQVGRGHGIWYGNDCIAGIVEEFVADPAVVPDASCAAVPVAVEWARP